MAPLEHPSDLLPPRIPGGRKRSVALLVVSLLIALVFQYAVAPAVVNGPDSLGYIKTAWTDGCDNLGNATLERVCAGNNGAFRPSFVSTIFFLLAAIAAVVRPTANGEGWWVKLLFGIAFVVGTIFIPNTPLFTPVYLNIARVGSVLFIMIQTLVFVEMGQSKNDFWLAKAQSADVDKPGSGEKWRVLILASSAILYALTIAFFVYMLVLYTGCVTNDLFIILTIVLCVVITAAQLFGGESCLLSSSIVCIWSAYVVFSAVTKNPDGTCNPSLGNPSYFVVAVGLLVTFLNVAWTGWSYAAERMLVADGRRLQGSAATKNSVTTCASGNKMEERETAPTRDVKGVVIDKEATTEPDIEAQQPQTADPSQSSLKRLTSISNSWRLNIVLATVACWKAVILTHWGMVASDGVVSNPQAGFDAMWLLMSSQWFIMVLHVWTLIAPRLFPGREFSG